MHLPVGSLEVLLAEEEIRGERCGAHCMYYMQYTEEHEPIDERFKILVIDLCVDGGAGCDAKWGSAVRDIVFLFLVILCINGPSIDGIQWCPLHPG